jgi:hypothetical protein
VVDLTAPTAVTHIGYYCGRFGPGWWGEPLNSLSNAAFVFGAIAAFWFWRARPDRDRWQLPLFALAASIGLGSFVFHSHPTPATLVVDLVPIQVFGLAALAYVGVRYVGLGAGRTVALLIAFFVVRQVWIRSVNPGLLGGGITHVPAVVLLFGFAVVLKRRRAALANFLLLACAAYVAALWVRSWDLPLCATIPIGLHWVWHLLTATAATLIICGAALHPPERRGFAGG